MPYLTPQSLPEDDDCRPLSIPASSEWLALFGGALTELTLKWNWQDSGGLTVDETLAKMTEIIDAWYTTPCDHCELPEGGRIIRIGEDGRIQELDENGDWVDATGDYAIPPPDAREGGTPDDQICLAAKNAVNVLHELYDQLQEYFDDELSDAAALLGLAGFMTTVTAFEFAPIVAGIAAFMLPIFAGVYSALSYLTADLWSDNLDKQITCFLVECATNTDGVVTFDWDCFTGKLNSLTDSFGLSEVELRFYLQISYLLFFIGGVDGLNLAAGTTEITDDICPCDCEIHIVNPNYGTTTYLGSHQWSITSTFFDGYWRINVGDADEQCWCYTDYTHSGATIQYQDCINCSSSGVGMPNACCETDPTKRTDDIVKWYMYSDAGSFTITFYAYCKEECE